MTKKIIILFIVAVVLAVGFYFWQSMQQNEKVINNDSSLADVKERGKLVVGGDAPYGVMEFFNEEGDIIGVDIDIVREIASRMGIELEYKDYDWEPLFDAIKSGEIDLAASALTITPERKEEMIFSTPYFNGGQTVIVRDDNEDIKGASDLGGKKVGTQVGSTGYDTTLKYTEKSMITTYESAGPKSEMMTDLLEGKTDAVVVDYIAAISIVKEVSGLKITGDPFTQEFYGFASKLGNKALIEKIDEILRDMKREGMLKDIQNKWVKQ